MLGTGVYLIAEDEGSKNEYLQPSKVADIDLISVNGSGYISEDVYRETIRKELMEKLGEDKWNPSIFSAVYDLYTRGAVPSNDVSDILKKKRVLPEGEIEKNKALIQKLSDYFSDKKFKRSRTSELQEAKILKVTLLSEDHIVDGFKSLKENGYDSVDLEKVYKELRMDKQKSMVAFLERAISHSSQMNHFSEGDHTAYRTRLELLKKLTEKIKSDEKDSTKDGLQLMKQ